jgi:hypothetical protein
MIMIMQTRYNKRQLHTTTDSVAALWLEINIQEGRICYRYYLHGYTQGQDPMGFF